MLLLGQFSLVALDGAYAEFRVPATPGLEWVPRLLPNDVVCLLSALTTPLTLARPLLENARVPSSTLASPRFCAYLWTIIPFMDHSLALAKGLAQLSEAMSQARQGHPRRTGHSEEF